MTNPYLSVTHLCLHHGVILPIPRHWWLLHDSDTKEWCAPGEITGIGGSIRGIAVATNGIMIALLKGDETLNFGHRQWFAYDGHEQGESPGKKVVAVDTSYREELFV